MFSYFETHRYIGQEREHIDYYYVPFDFSYVPMCFKNELMNARIYQPFFASFAQLSFKVTVRLKTNLSAVLSLSK